MLRRVKGAHLLVVAGSAIGDGERRGRDGDLGGSHCKGVEVGVEGECGDEGDVECCKVGCDG